MKENQALIAITDTVLMLNFAFAFNVPYLANFINDVLNKINENSTEFIWITLIVYIYDNQKIKTLVKTIPVSVRG